MDQQTRRRRNLPGIVELNDVEQMKNIITKGMITFFI